MFRPKTGEAFTHLWPILISSLTGVAAMKNQYSMVEGWMELGDFEEAEREFRKIPGRSLSTRPGLMLWLRLSRDLGRWEEVEFAAHRLRSMLPQENFPIICEAEALHHQGNTTQAVILLASKASHFTGGDWPAYLTVLKAYVALINLPPETAALFEAVVKMTAEEHSTRQAAAPADCQLAQELSSWLRED